MTDLLDDLRDANPVDPAALDLPTRRPSASPRPRRRLAVGGGVVVAAVAVLAVVVAGGEPADRLALVDRAYAAVARPGIVHWRTDVTITLDGRANAAQSSEGWSSEGVTHVLDRVGGRLVADRRVEDGRQRMWIATDDDYLETPAPRSSPSAPIAGEDPLRAFRRAYRAGRLRADGPGRFRVVLGPSQRGWMRMAYEVDPRTARPRRLVVTADAPAADGRPAQRWVSTFSFAVYETLPATSANRALLDLLPHPGAGPSDEPAARSFAALRQGAPVTGADRALLERIAGNMRRFDIDLDGIRALGPGLWLAPGHGYVCLVAAVANGTGASCSTIAQAKRRGIGIGTGLENGRPGSGHRTVAVPDGVRAVRAQHAGRWRTYRVRDGVVTLPGISGATGLVR